MREPAAPRIAIYPGSFDPITCGHEDIVRRALRFVDRVIVAVAHRATHAKQGLFPIGERVEMIREVFADEAGVDVVQFTGLLVEFARERDARHRRRVYRLRAVRPALPCRLYRDGSCRYRA
jgi:pantetheine-phosphate adenylyltransferase